MLVWRGGVFGLMSIAATDPRGFGFLIAGSFVLVGDCARSLEGAIWKHDA